jgi:virulence factor Mce-like protein
MRRVVVVALLLGGCVAGAMVMLGTDERRTATGKQYKVVFDNAFGLTEGGEVKIGGVTAGKIHSFALTKEDPIKVEVGIRISEPGFDALRTDASCAVRQQSLIGEYFVDCQLGRAKQELADGGTVPVSRTSSTIPLDLVNNVMRRPYRERFRILLTELGVGLAGRPGELNEVIRRAHPGLRETSQTLKILADQNKVIRDFIENADRTSRVVHPRRAELSRWAKEASETATVQASRRDDIARQWNRLPAFLSELRPTMSRLEATANEQIPTLKRLETGGPRLRAFLAQLGPFSEASRPSIKALGEASVVGREAVTVSLDEVKQLRSLAEDAPELAKPLRQFLQSIDDRSRSTDNDPLAAKLAPPAPDKTAYKPGQGFTGMEALINYVYWQTLGINAFDEVSKILRIAVFTGSCSAYNAKPTPAQFKACGANIGPTQPGFNAADPTEGPELGRRAKASGGDAGKRNLPELPPEAPPTPGQPDPSRPQIVLPDGIRAIVDSVRSGGGGRAPPSSGSPATANQLLDYLLAP